MAEEFNNLVQNPSGIYTNPAPTGSQITDEFIDPPSPEKSNRSTGVKLNKKRSTNEFFDTLFVTKVPIDQNSFDAVMGFLVKKGFTKNSSGPVAGQILAITYYSKKPVWYWLDQLNLLPNVTEINLKIVQVLNSLNNGNFYLGIKSTSNTNPYISRLLIK